MAGSVWAELIRYKQWLQHEPQLLERRKKDGSHTVVIKVLGIARDPAAKGAVTTGCPGPGCSQVTGVSSASVPLWPVPARHCSREAAAGAAARTALWSTAALPNGAVSPWRRCRLVIIISLLWSLSFPEKDFYGDGLQLSFYIRSVLFIYM